MTRRTVRIGYETYPLRNISRVSVHTVEWAERPPIGEVGPPLAILAFSVVGLIVTQGSRTSSGTNGGVGTFLVIVLLVSLVWLLVVLARKRYRTALIIESAGDVSTALLSKSRDDIHRLEAAVVGALENPPEQPQLIHIGDVVRGDKVGGNKYQQRSGETASTG